MKPISTQASSEKPAAEKPAETGTIISAPIEVKKGPTMEEKKASAGECPAGQAKDWAGICFPIKECKASISAQPGTCAQSEEEKTNGVLTGALKIKKPATSSNPVSENCLKTETKSGESLCLNAPAISKLTPAYQTGWYGARAGLSASEASATKKFEVTTRFGSGYMSGYNPNGIKECNAGYADYKSPFLHPINNGEKGEKSVPERNCQGPAGTNNGIGRPYMGEKEVNGKCVPSTGVEGK